MGTLKYVKGDMLDTDHEILCHGCNCLGGFGSGAAGAIAKRWPHVRQAYLKRHREVGWKLGDVQFVYLISYTDETGKVVQNIGGRPIYVVNMATQYDYGYDGKLRADYDAIRKCLEQVIEQCEMNDDRLAMPKVGCGLAGGDWNVVEKILLDILKNHNVDVTVYVV